MGLIINPANDIIKMSSLQKGLVGHWPLDKESLQSATIFADKTPNENRGTSANAPVFTTDRMGQTDRAMSFDGVSDTVRIPDSVSLSPTSAMTAMVWVKGAGQDNKGVFDKFDYNANKVSYKISSMVTSPYQKMRVIVSDDGTLSDGHRKTYDSSINILDGLWHLIGFTFNAGTLKIYVDRVEDISVTKTADDPITTIFISDQDVMIGSQLSNNVPTSFFTGDLSEPKMFNHALTDAEWKSAFETYRPKVSLSSLIKGLVLDMPLNSQRYNPGNSKFDDLTPYENRGVNSGGDVDTDHTTFISTNSDHVRIPDSVSLSPLNAMTAMIWMKGAAQNSRSFFSHSDANQISFTLLSPFEGTLNKLRVTCTDNGTYTTNHRKSYTSSIVALDNTWHLVGFSFDSGTLKLFVDGVYDDNPTRRYDNAITTIHNSTADVMVGCYLNSDIPIGFFNGDLARAKMWNRALTDAEWLLAYDKTKGLYL